MTAFIGLLLLAFLGSMIMGGRAVRGYGLPSGSEYLLLGFLLGPAVLGVVTQEILEELFPFLMVGAGWLLLLSGLEWGVVSGHKTRIRAVAGSFLLALLTGALMFFAALFVLGKLGAREPGQRYLLAGGVAAVGMETTRNAVRWVMERYGAEGPLSRAIATLSDADELPALLLVGALFVLAPLPEVRLSLAPAGWFVITLGLGATLGLTCVALMGRKLHRGEAQGFVLGAALLGTGLCAQLGLAGVTCCFVLGVTLSRVSPHRPALLAILKKSEQPVVLPVLLLTGALVAPDDPRLPTVLLAALSARLLGKLLSGLALFLRPAGRRAGPLLGLGLLPSGAVTLCLALTLSMRLGGEDGKLLLATAAAMTLFGELLGPLSLRRALRRAGELQTRGSEPPSSGIPISPPAAES